MPWELVDQGGPLGCDLTYRFALDPVTTAGGYLYASFNGGNSTIPPSIAWVPGPAAAPVTNTGTV